MVRVVDVTGGLAACIALAIVASRGAHAAVVVSLAGGIEVAPVIEGVHFEDADGIAGRERRGGR
ncbi:MAG: hypothetical protein K0R41_2065 [Geminicoccaceae bacterium]|jgi:hypothetical protein|nr:hypothetical protein [Geminicoccaceae bacterium]